MPDLDAPAAAPPAPVPAPPTLRDAWPWAAPFRLTGWLERNGFTPGWTAFLAFVLAFLLFQLVVAPLVIGIGIAIDVARSGQTEAPDMSVVLEQVQENGRLLMTANTAGQIVGFALFALLLARLHSPEVREYLRIRRPDLPALGLAALGWAVLYPAVLWSGQINEQIPMPEWLRAMEQTQVDLLEGILLGDDLGVGFLFVALALTPAVCEELLFRGYLQRQVERVGGAVWSIVLVGIFFGLYHLRLSQAIPLSLLGVYLGYVVWATGSLWAGVLVHLLNNGLAVVVASRARVNPAFDPEALEAMELPWYFGVAGLALAAAVCRALYLRRQSVVGDRPDALPAAPDAVPLSATPLAS